MVEWIKTKINNNPLLVALSIIITIASPFGYLAKISYPSMKPIWVYSIIVFSLVPISLAYRVIIWAVELRKNKLVKTITNEDLSIILSGNFENNKFIFNDDYDYKHMGGFSTSEIKYLNKGKEIYRIKTAIEKFKIQNKHNNSPYFNPYYEAKLNLPTKIKEYEIFITFISPQAPYTFNVIVKQGNEEKRYENRDNNLIIPYVKEDNKLKFYIQFLEPIKDEDFKKEATLKVFIKSFTF